MDMINLVVGTAAIILTVVCLVTGSYLVWRSFGSHRKNLNNAMNEDLEVIRVRHRRQLENKSAQADSWKDEVKIMEDLFAALAQLAKRSQSFMYGTPHFTLEIANPSGSEEISFFISVPKKYRSAFEKQVHSYFTDAEVEKIEDYTIFAPGSEVAVGTLQMSKTHALPLFTYADMSTDSLNEITTALSKLSTVEEGACIQLVMQAAPSGWASAGRKIAHEMQQGKRLSQVSSSLGSGFFQLILDGIGAVMNEILGIKSSAKKNDHLQNDRVELTPEEQELIRAIENKSSKAAFAVNVRLIASARTEVRAQEIVAHMENAFAQFERNDINRFRVRNHTKGAQKIIFNYIFRMFNKSQSMILGIEEIASIFHFPISTTDTPKIKWLKAGSAPPPTNIPEEGIMLGFNDYRGHETEIRIGEGDRRRHIYTIGQTGTGKSTFLQEMAKQDIRSGKGMCFIDPHGDAIEDIMTAIPKERAKDVVYFDPSDTERPFGLNMMEYERPEEKTFVVNEMINIFDKLYDLKSTGGPMFEQYMRNAMLLVMDDPESGSTLMEIPKVLADADFRKMKLEKCKNVVVRDFWLKEAEKAGGEASLANMVPYITSKLTPFLSNDMMRPIISQQKSTLNFREAMDEGKIVLINLSKGKIGELNSYLLGMVIVGKILMAALSRTDIDEDQRRDFYLYIDEFQNVTTDSIAQILSEARKYRLALIIAHQFIGQLSDDISKAVFGNVGSIVAFRVGAEDADFLEKQFTPVFEAQDLINTSNHHCLAKLLMNNTTVSPFNMGTYPPSDGSEDLVPHLKELSRLTYGRDRVMVEQEVMMRSKMAPKEVKEKEHFWK